MNFGVGNINYIRNKYWKLNLFVVLFIYILLISSPFSYASGFSTPDVASFTTETGQNVNLYTGAFSLGIPIMEIPARSFSYPLNLGYSSGIQFYQDSSSVGLGWNLNPGSITRTVQNIPDDYLNQVVSQVSEGSSWQFVLNLIFADVHFTPNGVRLGVQGNPSGIGFSGSPITSGAETTDYTWTGLIHLNNAAPMYLKYAGTNICDMPYGTGYPDNRLDVTPDLYVASSSTGLAGSFSTYRSNLDIECSSNCDPAHQSDCEGCLNKGTCGTGGLKYYFENSPINKNKIEYSTGQDGRIKYFIVTDENGVRYIYSHPVYIINSHIVSETPSAGNLLSLSQNAPYAYTWLLTAVLAPNYVDRSPFISHNDYSPSSTNRNINGIGGSDEGDYVYLTYNLYNTNYLFEQPLAALGGIDEPGSYLASDTDDTKSSEISTSGHKELYEVTRIDSPTNYAEFYTSFRLDDREPPTGGAFPKKLDYILLKAKADPVTTNYISKVLFTYDYSLHQNSIFSTAPNGGKLTLTQLNTYGENSQSSIPPYKFYYNYNPIPSSDQNVYKHQFDAWGYFSNAGQNNYHLLGTQPWLDNYQFDEKAWSITKIEYPTGGSLEIEYEPNSYRKIGDVGIVHICPGVTPCQTPTTNDFRGYGIRTKWIKTNDGIGTSYYTRYYYLNGDLEKDTDPSVQTSGVLTSMNIGHYGHRILANLNVLQNDFYIGGATKNYVGYGKVAEVPAWNPSNPSLEPYGRIVHEFSTSFNEPNGKLETVTDYGTRAPGLLYVDRVYGIDRDWRRGMELSTKYYNNVNTLIKRVDNTYSRNLEKTFKFTVRNSNGPRPYPAVQKEWGYSKLDSTTTTLDGVQSSISYQYNDLGQLKQSSETNGDGRVRIKKITYAHERPEYSQMLKWNILTPVYSEEVYENSLANGNLKKMTQQTYKRFNLRTDPQ